jgi:hypothetical protein
MRRKDKSCFLHIGAPKTGSTALQKFLASNRDALTRLGWEYPDVNLRGFGHHDLAFLISGGYPEWALPQERTLDELSFDLISSVAERNNVIISSENFYLFPNPEGIAEILRKANFPYEDVKVVLYVRRQDNALVSWYNQVIKAQGYSGSFAECISCYRDLWDYATRLEAWSDVFGRNNVIVRPYQFKDLVENDIRRDFLRLAGLSPDIFDWSGGLTNTRINRDLLEFQRLVNQLPLTPLEKRRFHRELIELTSATEMMDLFDDSPLLTATQRQEILSSYADSNTRVAKSYLGREQLFDVSVSAEPVQPEKRMGLSIEKLIYIFSWILVRHFEKRD